MANHCVAIVIGPRFRIVDVISWAILVASKSQHEATSARSMRRRLLGPTQKLLEPATAALARTLTVPAPAVRAFLRGVSLGRGFPFLRSLTLPSLRWRTAGGHQLERQVRWPQSPSPTGRQAYLLLYVRRLLFRARDPRPRESLASKR